MSENENVVQQNKTSLFFTRIWNSIKHFFSTPSNVILLVFGIILSVVVLYPLATMILDSFKVHSFTEARNINDIWDAGVKSGQYTFYHWPYLLFNKETPGYSKYYFWRPLGLSVVMALVACTIAVLFGGTLAFLITRTNIPGKKFISTVFVFPYIMPSWSIAMFWVNFFQNTRIEAASDVGMLQSITGICAPSWLVFGMWPTAFVLGLHYAPFAYILIGGILRNMDANLEEAAVILKASRAKILGRITLPIVAPALVSTVLLVFASSISSYSVPAFLNADGSFQSISITLRSALIGGRKGEGYVISTILMIFSVLILTINNWFTRSRRSFTTVSGKSGQISKINLRKAKWPIFTVIAILVTFFAIVPLLTFIIYSLEDTPGMLNTIDLKYWFSNKPVVEDAFVEARQFSTKGLFLNKTILSAFGRTVLVAIVVSLICGTSGILIGYAVARKRRSRVANFVSSLAFLPYLIPALSFGAMFFALSKTKAFGFLDVAITMKEISAILICIIAGGIKFLPFASRSGTNAMLQLSGEIEEAAIITGCPWAKRMTRIIFPIQKSSFISGYLLPFISCMREYTLFTLITSSVTLTTNVLEYYSRNGISQLANGINLFLVIFVIGVNLIVNKVTGASIDKGIGG